jgi:hypothetical protein
MPDAPQLSGSADVSPPLSPPAPEPPRPPVVDDPLPDHPHLYVNAAGNHRVGARGLRSGDWRPVGALSAYAPVSWLMHGAEPPAVTVTDVVTSGTDLAEAVRFLTETERTNPADTTGSFLGGLPGRTVEQTSALPAALPEGTLIWYTGRTHTGAAVVLPGGGFRRAVADATLIAQESGALGGLGEGPHTFVIARPRAATTPAHPVASVTTRSPASTSDVRGPTMRTRDVEEAAATAHAREVAEFTEEGLRRRLANAGLRRVGVAPDNNCFYATLLTVADRHLVRHIPGLAGMTPGRRRGPDGVRALRNWLADRLAADLAVANQGLPARYANAFHFDTDESSAEQQRRLVNQIREMWQWDSQATDVLVELAGRELGLPLEVYQERYLRSAGPQGETRIPIVRTPNHYDGAEHVRPGSAPQVPWDALRPLPTSSVEEARNGFMADVGAQDARLRRAMDQFQRALAMLPPGTGDTHAAQVSAAAHDYRTARANDAFQDLPAHVRAVYRLDRMRRAAGEVETATQAMRQDLDRQGVQTFGSDPEVVENTPIPEHSPETRDTAPAVRPMPPTAPAPRGDSAVSDVYRPWTGRSVLPSVARLERALLTAGPGAVSLVVAEGRSGNTREYTVVDRDGRITWYDSATGRPTTSPTDADTVAASSLDLGPDGSLLTHSATPPASGRDTASFWQVRSEALAAIGILRGTPSPSRHRHHVEEATPPSNADIAELSHSLADITYQALTGKASSPQDDGHSRTDPSDGA